MDLVVETSNALVCPVFPQLGQNVAQSIRLGDGAIYVRDDHLVIPIPQVDGGFATAGALVLGRHTEDHIVSSFVQV